jgi:hypothetical protein
MLKDKTQLIRHGSMLRLAGDDIVHYFHEKHIPTHTCFQYMLSCIRHDDIVHKIDATSFRILVSPEFYVSPLLLQLHIHYFSLLLMIIPLLTDSLEYES